MNLSQEVAALRAEASDLRARLDKAELRARTSTDDANHLAAKCDELQREVDERDKTVKALSFSGANRISELERENARLAPLAARALSERNHALAKLANANRELRDLAEENARLVKVGQASATREAELVNALLAVAEAAAERHVAHRANVALDLHQAHVARDLATHGDLLKGNQQQQRQPARPCAGLPEAPPCPMPAAEGSRYCAGCGEGGAR